MEAPTEGVACRGRPAVGPEHRQELVAATVSPGPGESQVGQERKPLGLGDDTADRLSIGIEELEGAERQELDHGTRGNQPAGKTWGRAGGYPHPILTAR